MLAELLIRTVQATAVGLNIQPLAMAELDPPRERLLPPLQPGNYETNSSSCWLGVRSCEERPFSPPSLLWHVRTCVGAGRWSRSFASQLDGPASGHGSRVGQVCLMSWQLMAMPVRLPEPVIDE